MLCRLFLNQMQKVIRVQEDYGTCCSVNPVNPVDIGEAGEVAMASINFLGLICP